MGAPARAHVLPGAGRRSPARAFWATAAAPPEPGRGISLPPVGGKGARAGPPSSAPSDSCQPPGSAWHPAGLSEESLLGVAELLEGRGGSGELGGSRGRPRSVPRARTPDSSGLRREGAAAGPGRACAPTRCHPWGLVSAPGLAPSPLWRPRGPERPSGRGPEKCGRFALRPAAATSESARARARRACRACQDSLGYRPQPQGTPTLILWVVGGRGEAILPAGVAGSGGS